MNRCSIMTRALVALATTATIEAHVTPVVIMRKQADVIRAALPGATQFFVTNVKIGKPELQQIIDRGHFSPDADAVKFYSGKSADGRVVGTVVFVQIDTHHGPIETGVAIAPDDTVMSVSVTRATVEVKPWILDVEQSGVLDKLKGARASETPKRLSDDESVRGMTGYIADAIATVTYRALILDATLGPH